MQQYGWGLGLLLWIITITVLETRRHLPGLVDWWKQARGKEQEFKQKKTLKAQDQERLELLVSMGSQTFMEEQLTQLTSDSQSLNQTLIDFMVKEATTKLDAIVAHNIRMSQRYVESENRVLEELQARLSGYQRRLDSIEQRLMLIEGLIVNDDRYDREPDTGTDRGP